MQSKEKKAKKAAEELKICVRKLPPNLTQEVFMKSIANHKDKVGNFYFVQGKNKAKYASFGRAYITFTNQQMKNEFLKEYKPMFIDEKGNRYMAKVEPALYQKDSKSNTRVAPNPNDGKYQESEEFQSFLERLRNPKQAAAQADNLNRKSAVVEEASTKKPEKTPLIMDIEKRLNDKRIEKEAKKRKEKDRDRESKREYVPKTVIVYQKKEK